MRASNGDDAERTTEWNETSYADNNNLLDFLQFEFGANKTLQAPRVHQPAIGFVGEIK